MRFGANYTPRKDWFHSWLDLDLTEVRRDFDQLAALGLDHVRIFPIWPLLQPNRGLIRPQALDDVARVVRAAHEAGLDSVVDVLQGHLSSFDFLPSWVSSWHRDNLFTSGRIRSGQRALVAQLGERLAAEEGLIGLSVGNEFIQFAAERHPFAHHISFEDARSWLAELLGEARRVLPGGLHTHSYDDDIFFDPTHPFTPELAVELGDVTTVHSWVFGRLGPHVGVDHPWLGLFARYLCELAVAWSPDPHREVWLQEVGAPITHVSAEKSGQFVTNTLDALLGLPGLWGITWWCSHDVSRRLADFPELEYSLGLIDAEGKVKDTGRAFAQWIDDHQDRQVPPVVEREILVFDDESLVRARVDTRPDEELFSRWATLAERGTPPGLVARSRAEDDAYLRARGLTR